VLKKWADARHLWSMCPLQFNSVFSSVPLRLYGLVVTVGSFYCQLTETQRLLLLSGRATLGRVGSSAKIADKDGKMKLTARSP